MPERVTDILADSSQQGNVLEGSALRAIRPSTGPSMPKYSPRRMPTVSRCTALFGGLPCIPGCSCND